MKRLPPNSLLPTPEAARYACVQPRTLSKHITPVRALSSGKPGRPVLLWRVSDLDWVRDNVALERRKAVKEGAE